MRVSRLNKRTVMLILAEAIVIFGAIVVAVYARLGVDEGFAELTLRQGLLKAGFATIFSLTAFYLFDLYDFIVMHDRRELVLRLVPLGLVLSCRKMPMMSVLGRSAGGRMMVLLAMRVFFRPW